MKTLADQALDFAQFAGCSEEEARKAILNGLRNDRVDSVAGLLVRQADGVQQDMDSCMIGVKQWQFGVFDWTTNTLVSDPSKRASRGRYDPPVKFKFIRAEAVRLSNTSHGFHALKEDRDRAMTERLDRDAAIAGRSVSEDVPTSPKRRGPKPILGRRVVEYLRSHPEFACCTCDDLKGRLKEAGINASLSTVFEAMKIAYGTLVANPTNSF